MVYLDWGAGAVGKMNRPRAAVANGCEFCLQADSKAVISRDKAEDLKSFDDEDRFRI